jgi:hypothetical protein
MKRLASLLFSLGALWNATETIASAATAFRISDEYAAFYESGDITQGGVVGTLCKLRPFFCGELSVEAIEEPIEHKALALV